MKLSNIKKSFMNSVMTGLALVGGIGSVPAAAQSQQRSAPAAAQSVLSGCVTLTPENAYPQRTPGLPESILPGYGITLAMNRDSHLDVYIPNGDQDVKVVSIERDGTVRDYASGILCTAGSAEANRYNRDLRDDLYTIVRNQREDVQDHRYVTVRVNKFLNRVVSGVARGTSSRSTNIGRNLLGNIADVGFEIARQRGQLRDSAVMVSTVAAVNQYNLFLQAAERSGEYVRRQADSIADADRVVSQSNQVVSDEVRRRCNLARERGYTPDFCRR